MAHAGISVPSTAHLLENRGAKFPAPRIWGDRLRQLAARRAENSACIGSAGAEHCTVFDVPRPNTIFIKDILSLTLSTRNDSKRIKQEVKRDFVIGKN
jgi:hypothetical protein